MSRAVEGGTGNIKAGGNYAASLLAELYSKRKRIFSSAYGLML